LRVARAWGVPPLRFFNEINPRERALMLALDLHEDSLCPCGCGQPIDLAHDPDSDWNIDERVCYARRALDSDRSERQPGTFLVAVPDEEYLEWKARQD